MDFFEKKWYVVSTIASHENKVKRNIEQRIESLDMQDNIFQVIVAEYETPQIKDGQVVPGKYKTANLYPGYIFIEMIMSDEAWYVVRNTPGVTGFIGSSGKGTKPFPVPNEQIEAVLKRIGMGKAADVSKFQVGDKVRDVVGTIGDQIATIKSIDYENNKALISYVYFSRIQESEVSIDELVKA